MDVQPEGYAVDRTHPDIVYVPENVNIDLRHQTITWTRDGEHTIRLEAGKTYVLPSGYKVEMLQPHRASAGASWAPPPRAPSATSPAPSPAAASPRSPSPSPTPPSTAGHRADFKDADMEGARDHPHAILAPLPRPRPARQARPPAAQSPALARLGRAPAHPASRLHRRVQRLAAHHPALGARPCPHHQALLQARLGRGLALPLHRGHGQRRARLRC
jgi:hypothetical protein